MSFRNREPWVLNLIINIANTLFFLSTICFIGFFVLSSQGITESMAKLIMNFVSIISAISILLLLSSIIAVFFKRNRVRFKVTRLVISVVRIVLSLIYLLFLNVIYVLSLGT